MLADVFDTYLARVAAGVPALYACGHGVAAAETARLMTTTTVEDDDDLKEFTRRRLAAVPNVSIFHAGGPLSWDIELGRAGAGGVSSVSVAGEVKPLP